MKNNSEKGFALVLSLVLMVVMSLMGGALIIISAGDHASNNESDNYQQTFYVAETGLLEGERALLNQFLGPLTDFQVRDRNARNYHKTILMHLREILLELIILLEKSFRSDSTAKH